MVTKSIVSGVEPSFTCNLDGCPLKITSE